MKKKRNSCWAIALALLLPQAGLAQAASDSIKVVRLLEEAKALPADSSRTLFFALKLVGTPYAVGTLEEESDESLVVRLDGFDCTTFVETVSALALCDRQQNTSFLAFKRNLMQLRYRTGICQGYLSRLHYFSDWVNDNEKKGLVKECTEAISPHTWIVTLNYMSEHSQAYPALRRNPELIDELKAWEAPWKSYAMPYIPKAWLNRPFGEIPIPNGSVIALTTTIAGLDVSHVGFAYWIEGKLHLLHASSSRKQVVIDPLSLYEYQKGRKTHTGIRVISLL